MIVKEIVASVSVKINTGNYESMDRFLSVKAEIDELDDEMTEVKKLSALAERAMMVQLIRCYQVRGKNLTPTQIAKQHGLTYLPKEDQCI